MKAESRRLLKYHLSRKLKNDDGSVISKMINTIYGISGPNKYSRSSMVLGAPCVIFLSTALFIGIGNLHHSHCPFIIHVQWHMIYDSSSLS